MNIATIDGENIGDNYYTFDLLSFNGDSFKENPYIERYQKLKEFFVYNKFEYIQLAPLIIGTTAKRKFFNQLKKDKKEGIVFKRLSSEYKHGRPSSGGDQLKCKFYATCSAVVSRINLKRSVGLNLFDDKGQIIDVGNVTIQQNQEIPNVGDIIEVRYLYAFLEGSLYQPTYLGKRDDVSPKECVTSQLKYKTLFLFHLSILL